MCNPTLAMVAVGAGSGYQLHQQRRNARAQERFMAQARQQQDQQINQQRGLDMDNRIRRARAERARLRAMSAETGLTGITMSTLLRDVDFQSGRDVATLEQNRQNQLTDSQMRHQSNLNQISQPDFLGTALNAGLQVYGIGQQAGKWGGP